MTAHPKSLPAKAGGSILVVAMDRRIARAVVATLVIGGYMALGFAFRLGAEAYLLLGIPITIGFQILVVRRPLRSLWLRQAPPLTFTPRSMVAIVGMAIAPAVVATSGVRDGDPALVGWGLAGMVGAVGAVYALRAMDRDAVRSTITTTLITGVVLVGIMVAYRLASGGFNGNLAGAITTTVISLLTYLPVVFVLEEVLFRGLIDTYLHGSTPGPDGASALYGSALWGVWHLPVAFLVLGVLTIPYLVIVHTTLGYFMATAWRRTGNLAVPGVSHAMIDALRNAVAVF
jgi:membrane protease YdiL (CAAX protease family)